MSELDFVEQAHSELVDDSAQFFAPVSSDLFSELLGQYQSMRSRIESVSALMLGEASGAAGFLLEGNRDPQSLAFPSVTQAFELKGGIAALNSHYWSKVLSLTDVREMMPQKRREEWDITIRELKAPDFTEEAVRPTITELLNMRSQFLAERVDGIFRSLSGDHVTNVPEGFGRRMIFAGLRDRYSRYSQRGVVNDLRCVVAKFMGRDEPKWRATDRLVDALESQFGEWVNIDGGALRIRLYKKGTAHLEVHPNMAWRLNSVLASLYPLAIPAQFRQRPVKKAMPFTLMNRPLPFNVIELLAGLEKVYVYHGERGWGKKATLVPNALKFDRNYGGKVERAEAAKVLGAIGGAQVESGVFHFDYDARPVILQICASGCIPDQKSHQYYPTPEKLARMAVDLADINDEHTVLEPSAGQGGIADYLPKERTTCVEVSSLHCKVLEAKGYRVTQADFLALHTNRDLYDRVVMNPPFDQGRWQAHLEHAAKLVKTGGCLVAILPSGAKNRTLNLSGLSAQWHGPFDNKFAGTSVSVVMLKATRGAA